MDIVIHVLRDGSGRLTGTATGGGEHIGRQFTGTFELVACIESLCPGPAPADHAAPTSNAETERNLL